MANFKVDTKLFRELGELLVGRETTALIELIKNSYDADATLVAVSGKNLTDQSRGEITITDDGVGMTKDQFEAGFLTIAGRSKVAGTRRSAHFKRRFTGEKGIGRLAAHKLAKRLKLISRAWDHNGRDAIEGFASASGVSATINWDAVEKFETLDAVTGDTAIKVEALTKANAANSPAGTRIHLSPLRRVWTTREMNRFFDEVATLTPPAALTGELSSKLGTAKPLLQTIRLRDQRGTGDFKIQFLDEFAIKEPDIVGSTDAASWIIEIDCDATDRRISIQVTPTSRFKAKYPNAETFFVRRKIAPSAAMVSFQARILQKDNGSWGSAYRGVRVYHEGFRVLPYGDARDDWLELDRDYRSRARQEIGRLQRYSTWNLPPAADEREGLVLQGNNALFGAVFLTRDGAPNLQFLANREGFLPSLELEFLIEMIRLGIDLQVRQRYAATSEVKDARRDEQLRQQTATKDSSVYESPSAFILSTLHSELRDAVSAARSAVASGHPTQAAAALQNAELKVKQTSDLLAGTTNEATMFRVLASMGLEQAAFVHEVNALATLSQGVAQHLEEIAATVEDARVQRKLKRVASDARMILERLRRNAVYLADMTGVEGRRRRSRQLLRERIEKSISHFVESASLRNVTLENAVDESLRTPPMFPAEVVAIVSNLLSNAIKFAGKGGHVKVTAHANDDELVVKVENTGKAVDLTTAAQWFQPFRSTTTKVDQTLGQGMGLGLTITRSLIEEYGGTIEFVKPGRTMATAIEFRLPL